MERHDTKEGSTDRINKTKDKDNDNNKIIYCSKLSEIEKVCLR